MKKQRISSSPLFATQDAPPEPTKAPLGSPVGTLIENPTTPPRDIVGPPVMTREEHEADRFATAGPLSSKPIDPEKANGAADVLSDWHRPLQHEQESTTATSPPSISFRRPSDPTPLPADAAMSETALVFLDDPIARRLAIAWTTCKGVEADWHTAAGLPRNEEVLRHCKALKLNAVCREGGVTDSLALNFIKAQIARSLPKTKKKG